MCLRNVPGRAPAAGWPFLAGPWCPGPPRRAGGWVAAALGGPDGLDACRLRIVRRQAGADVIDDGQQAVGVGLLDGTGATPDLVEQGGGRAALAGMVAVLDREVLAHVLLDSRAARGQGAEPLALFA